MMTLEELREAVIAYGIEDVLRVYYSTYRALVMRNDDPKERGRIQISCPQVGHDEKTAVDVWVSPMVDVTGDRFGWFNPPLVGSVVRVFFDNGDPSAPKGYVGGWFSDSDKASPVPKELGYVDGKPQKRGFRSRAGHLLMFDDTAGDEKVRLVWHKIADGDEAKTDPDKVAQEIAAGDKFSMLSFDEKSIQLRDADGALITINTEKKEILLQDASGGYVALGPSGISMVDAASPASSISLDAAGNVNIIASKNVNINAPNINLKGGGVFLGDTAALGVAIADMLLPWLAAHVHNIVVPVTGTPVSPPVAPPPPTMASRSVKVRT